MGELTWACGIMRDPRELLAGANWKGDWSYFVTVTVFLSTVVLTMLMWIKECAM